MTNHNDGPGPHLDAGAQWERFGRYPYLLAKLLVFGLILGAIFWTLGKFAAVVFPIFVSLLFAYLLDPTIDRLEARGLGRTPAILLVLLAGLIFVTIFAIFLYPTLANQARLVVESFPALLETLQRDALPWAERTFGIEMPSTAAAAMERYGGQIREALPTIGQHVGSALTNAVTRTGAVVASLVNAVMIPLFTFYFLRDFDLGRRSLMRFIPPHRYELFIDRLQKMDQAVGQWFRGQIQVALILAGMYALGLGIVYGIFGLDVQSGVVIGLLAGFLNVIPYFGFAVGSLLAVLVVLIQWSGWGALIGVGIVFGVTQMLEGYVITPRIVGDKVGLKPVTVIIVLLLGGNIGGLLGILLAIPVTGALKVLLPDIIAWYETTSFYTGKATSPAQMHVRARILTGEDGEQVGLQLSTNSPLSPALHALEVAEAQSKADPEPASEATNEGAGAGESTPAEDAAPAAKPSQPPSAQAPGDDASGEDKSDEDGHDGKLPGHD
ncbi:AI-2E family transporter [Lujinxingia vulgaris]|uniref:AI-2E family transporter n=1 Tax=Lujinxingia vulgaris TaxID=2600176 RepID=A0A5C6XET0_9DELT|nr:AI-2E family transporter [Lujinxingia vulgaris]TXD37865.1 AI-2E family transporter [Lujinxingia vulgaris]